MRIIELSDYSMTVMKDSDDPPWTNIGNLYRQAVDYDDPLFVDVGNQLSMDYISTKEYVYAAGRLILYFKYKIPERFHLHDKVCILDQGVYVRLKINQINKKWQT